MKKIGAKNIVKNVVWKEGKHYVAQCLNFDVSSFGYTKQSALKNIKEAIQLYLEGFPRNKIPMGTFHSILRQSGLSKAEF